MVTLLVAEELLWKSPSCVLLYWREGKGEQAGAGQNKPV